MRSEKVDFQSEGASRPYGERRQGNYGSRPYGDHKPYGDRKPYGSPHPFGEQRPYGERRTSGEQKPFGEHRSYGSPKPYGEQKPYGERKAYGEHKAYGAPRPAGPSKGKRPGRKPVFTNTSNEGIKRVISRKPQVDQYGKVQKAVPGADGTTVTDKAPWPAARNASLDTRNNMSSCAPARAGRVAPSDGYSTGSERTAFPAVFRGLSFRPSFEKPAIILG